LFQIWAKNKKKFAEIERSASSSGSGQLFSPSGFRSFIHANVDAAVVSPNET
jgi:hypothetical protein